MFSSSAPPKSLRKAFEGRTVELSCREHDTHPEMSNMWFPLNRVCSKTADQTHKHAHAHVHAHTLFKGTIKAPLIIFDNHFPSASQTFLSRAHYSSHVHMFGCNLLMLHQ